VPYTPDFFLWQQASNEIRFISSPPQTNQKILMMIFFQIEKERRKKKTKREDIACDILRSRTQFLFRIELQQNHKLCT